MDMEGVFIFLILLHVGLFFVLFNPTLWETFRHAWWIDHFKNELKKKDE